MYTTIRPMESKDKEKVIEMMRTFYASPAVLSNGSEEIFEANFRQCMAKGPYFEGYVFEDSGFLQGYATVAKTFSAEFGKPCIWIEDLYIKPAHRNLGLGGRFLIYIQAKYPNSIFRLEVEAENQKAISVYRKNGFRELPYMQMKK